MGDFVAGVYKILLVVQGDGPSLVNFKQRTIRCVFVLSNGTLPPR